jgi:hypothetical protein
MNWITSQIGAREHYAGEKAKSEKLKVESGKWKVESGKLTKISQSVI